MGVEKIIFLINFQIDNQAILSYNYSRKNYLRGKNLDTSQLIILGNGFDLHCGLKSSYRDFFRHEILDTTVESFQIKKMKINNAGFWEQLLFTYYEVFGGIDYNWCDIENIIKNTLWLIYYGNNEKSENLENGLCFIALKSFETNKFLFDREEYQQNRIMQFICTYCTTFFNTIELKSKSFSEILLLLSNNLLKQLNILEQRFCKYLKNCIFAPNGLINKEYIVNAVNLLSIIMEKSNYEFSRFEDIICQKPKIEYKVIGNCGSDYMILKNYPTNLFPDFSNANILNFNYTALFDILGVDSPCIFNNVHGKLCKLSCNECNSSQIIFGIDDTLISTKNANSDLRLFSKTYRKMISQTLPTKILPSNENTLTIKFYGHSLSEADYSYFQSIFDYYNLYSNNKINLNFYYSKGYEQNDEIYKLLNTYGKTFSNQDQGKNLIHKLLLENRLSITEIS